MLDRQHENYAVDVESTSGGSDKLYGGDQNDDMLCGRGTDVVDGGPGVGDTATSDCETAINVP